MALLKLKEELSIELQRILGFWLNRCIDQQQGGVWGKMDINNRVFPEADKGAVLHTRVLWTFAAAHRLAPDDRLLAGAHQLFDYIDKYFCDPVHGGLYWSITYKGQPVATKKQVYAQAFAIYAFSEYVALTGSVPAKERAIELYRLIQQYSYDKEAGGYLEAFTASWQPMDDLRLSEKDANEKKTMNTHLHVLEAYTNLYRIWPNEELGGHIRGLLEVFYRHIVNKATGHMHLFFDEHWQVKGNVVSYGHDIEASWLLLEAASVLNDSPLLERFSQLALVMTDAVLQGIDSDGGLWYEFDASEKRLIKEKHWWPQAEALVGFVNAWQISSREEYAAAAEQTWQFIKQHILDTLKGEWFWGITENYQVMNEDKAGFWKCPYHNGRACLELMKRIS